tara:strand:+ start:869 stop:2506 length:1638 start_codon:yes stop_codon:yes gene_type:complete
MKRQNKDKTSPADLTSHSMGVGPIRVQRPVYVDLLPPCNHACPAGENIQAWLSLAQDEKFEEAWQIIMQDNPMPAVMGRVCYHPCEDGCNRTVIDSPVNIHAIERFIGDEAIRKNWKVKFNKKPEGKRVLIIGAGPSGLSAAYHLTRMGHSVEIHEAGPVAGGMMHFGIPAYRLPRNILDYEVRRIMAMGVKIVLNHKVEDVLSEKKAGSFDAVFIAVGAHLSKKIDIPSNDAVKIFDAITFLKQIEKGEKPKIGRRVAIYGGGNTAMDVARTAKRMGASEAMVIYRRDKEHMSAHEFEAEEALEEGVKINWLRTIKTMDENTFTVEIMKLVDGKPIPTGQFEKLEADTLILAVGQDTDTTFLKSIKGIEFKQDGTVIVNSEMMTGYEGIFAGGDMIPSERSVTVAIGHGKKAARHIDAFLRRTPYVKAPKHPIVGPEKLHLWYKTNAPKEDQAILPVQKRLEGFDEIKAGLSEKEILYESKRCLSCGNCFECDGCYGACPEEAIIKLGPGKRYEYNFDRCTGCAICYEQCPCHAIEMIPEPKKQ